MRINEESSRLTRGRQNNHAPSKTPVVKQQQTLRTPKRKTDDISRHDTDSRQKQYDEDLTAAASLLHTPTTTLVVVKPKEKPTAKKKDPAAKS